MVYLEAAFQGFFLKVVIRFTYTWGTSVRGSFPVMLWAVCLLFWWKWAPLWVFFKYFASFIIFLLCERLFWGNKPWWLPHNFKYIFYFNLTWKETFLKSTLRGWIFDKWLVLRQLFAKHHLCIGTVERFPS